MLQTEIKAKELDDDEAERQEGIHLTYVTKCDDAIAAAQNYLTSREGEDASVLNLRNEPNDPPEPNPFLPLTLPSEIARREQTHEEEVVAAQKRSDEIRESANAIWEEAQAAQEALRLLNLRHPDQDNFTSVSQQQGKFSSAADDWRAKQRTMNGNQEAPDYWIDLYSAGLLLPVHSNFSSHSTVSAELDVFHGKALEWFAFKLQGPSQVLTVDGAGGVIKKYQSQLVEFQLRTMFGQIITLKGSTMKLVASPHLITDWSK